MLIEKHKNELLTLLISMMNEKQNCGRILRLLILFCLYGICLPPLHAKQDIASPQQTGKTYTIKGVVLDFNNEPIIGASVFIPGTSIGVATDLDGNYVLKVPANTKNIEFSYIGYEKKVVPFNPKDLNVFRVVTMKEDSGIALEDVTIVAFAKQKKESVLGSVSTIKPAELKTTSSNLTTGFAGKLAGVVAYQRSGEPGEDNAEFFIRGVTTFGTGKADPLILIDNIELTSSDLARLNTDDIASFSILKDATATALYGARGANGVILVTTKEGTEGKMKLSFRVESSFSAPSKEVEIADPLTFMKLHNEAVRTRNPDGALPYLESAIAAREKGLNPMAYPMVYWKDMLFKDFTTNYRGNMSLSGGGRVARYYVALSYSRDNGILKQVPSNLFDNNIKLDKYTVRSNVNITKTTELGVRVSGTFDSYQGPIQGGSQVYSQAIKASPVLFPAMYAPDAANQYTNHPMFGNYGTSANYLNPYAEMARGYKEYENTVILAQLELKQDFSFITEGLKGRLLGNVTRTSYYDLQRSYTPFYYALDSYDKTKDEYTLSALNPDLGTDYLGYSPGSKKVGSSLYLEASLSYDRTFVEKHNVSGMLVYTVREGKSGNENTLQKSLPTRNLGLAGRFTYGFSDRYFAEFNFGYNGSERFDKSHRWGFFPSGGLGWVVSNEKFWADKPISKVINMLKLKGSYGLVGNDNISNNDNRFFYLSEVNMNNSGRGMNFGTNFDEGYNGISISRYANPKIGWEISHKMNVGFELKLFNDLEIQAEYFKERRTNILQERADIPSLMGFQAPIRANIGEAKGHGVDISLDYSHIFNKNWWTTVRGNFTYASSEFSEYEEPDYSATPWRSKIGSKLSQTYGYIAERLFVDDEDVANSPKQQFGEYTAGDIKYKDINRDGIIDEQDIVPIGYPTTPEIIYGFGFSVGYKAFDFNCFFQGSARSSFFISPLRITPFAQPYDPDNELGGKQANNALLQVIADNHWSESNQNMYAFWPRLSDTAISNNNQSSTWWLRDGTFLRMKSAEIGYTLPKRLTSKAKLENLRIYVSGTNLFNISKFKIWDTEMGNNGLGYPVQRVFNVGIQLSL